MRGTGPPRCNPVLRGFPKRQVDATIQGFMSLGIINTIFNPVGFRRFATFLYPFIPS